MDHPLLENLSFVTASYETPNHDKGMIALLRTKEYAVFECTINCKRTQEEFTTTIEALLSKLIKGDGNLGNK